MTHLVIFSAPSFALKQDVSHAMIPLLISAESDLSILRGALEPRVFVAITRAMWDHIGR